MGLRCELESEGVDQRRHWERSEWRPHHIRSCGQATRTQAVGAKTHDVRACYRSCGAEADEPMKNPGTAAVLSLLIPGVGQIYNGKFLRGIFWLIVTPGLWIGSGGTLGWICHLISAYTAYRFASRNQ